MGLGDTTNRLLPVSITLAGVRLISSGTSFSLFATNNQVYGTGQNGNQQFGLTQPGYYVPTLISFINSNITQISAGDSHSLYLANNIAYSCGNNNVSPFPNLVWSIGIK